MKVYLAGSVPKGDKEAEKEVDWRKIFIAVLKKKLKNVELFDPNIFNTIEGDSLAVTGADCMHIKESDLIIVNANEKLGAGTAMEFVVAKYFHKPVITVLPKNTHHRRNNVHFEGRLVKDWIHPFIDTFSDYIIEDIDQINTVLKNLPETKIKTISVIDEAIKYAKDTLGKINAKEN